MEEILNNFQIYVYVYNKIGRNLSLLIFIINLSLLFMNKIF